MTNRNMKSSQYYENIISDFLRYSIWAVVSNRKNKKIIKSAYYGNFDYVYFEGHEYSLQRSPNLLHQDNHFLCTYK